MTRLSFRSLVLFLALIVILLCGATSQPKYLQGTQLLPTFRMTFFVHELKEIHPPNPANKNEVLYFTDGSTTYFRSLFKQSPLLPGEPVSFKNQEVQWLLVPDPNYSNQYTARVYCITCNPKKWVLVAVNLGPPRPDLVARYNAKLPVPPLPVPYAGSCVPVTPPTLPPVEWFLTSGSPAKRSPAKDQGYFAMYANGGPTINGVFYKQPYGMTGGGAGAFHQAYGEIVYDSYQIPQNVTPAMFTPPTGYAPVATKKMVGGEIMAKENCLVCHMSGSGPTTFYLPPGPPKPDLHGVPADPPCSRNH